MSQDMVMPQFAKSLLKEVLRRTPMEVHLRLHLHLHLHLLLKGIIGAFCIGTLGVRRKHQGIRL